MYTLLKLIIVFHISLTLLFEARLGNAMFLYATAKALANRNGAETILPASSSLLPVFILNTTVVDDNVFDYLIEKHGLNMIMTKVSLECALKTNYCFGNSF